MSGTWYPDRDCVLRAFAGALLGALPLLYTMEMWWHGRTFTDGWILALYPPTIAVVLLSLLFGGFRLGASGHLGIDLLITLGIGILASVVTLLVVGQIAPGFVPLSAAVRMVAIEAIPCAIGAALAVTQLRPRERHPNHIDRRIVRLPEDTQKVLATIVGGVFFAFNIAPTEEVWMLTMEAEPYHFPLIVLFSVGVSYGIVFLADFAERPEAFAKGALGTPLAETFVSYLISLIISLGFLYAFRHVSLSTPLHAQVEAAVMLGYVTTIGGSAGRVLIAE
jgi:putative integral membrane protein (TIGR02587 family)